MVLSVSSVVPAIQRRSALLWRLPRVCGLSTTQDEYFSSWLCVSHSKGTSGRYGLLNNGDSGPTARWRQTREPQRRAREESQVEKDWSLKSYTWLVRCPIRACESGKQRSFVENPGGIQLQPLSLVQHPQKENPPGWVPVQCGQHVRQEYTHKSRVKGC